ncbi:MAG TPA: SpoIIE family protein phosphatase, partial [Bacteroidales bacterium]|nr:SpoIIE family protein phosphatase [Bacteroidales bacterium]
GEALFLYTDGVTEAMNVNYELFSEARLESALKAASQNTPGEIILQVSSAIENFTLGAQQSDDITMMVVRYNPA